MRVYGEFVRRVVEDTVEARKTDTPPSAPSPAGPYGTGPPPGAMVGPATPPGPEVEVTLPSNHGSPLTLAGRTGQGRVHTQGVPPQ